MINKSKKTTKTLVFIPATLKELLKDEALGGKLVIIFAFLALVLVNSPFSEIYNNLWTTYVTVGIGDFVISQDLRHWATEGLMSFFFLVVGLEIKREITYGEMKSFKKASLPIFAALGGMIVPALIFLIFNYGSDAASGWGIPMATDIAFAVAVLSLLGNRVPLNLKLFLLTLAVADDIGAILVVALFYAEIINYAFLALSCLTIILMFILRKFLSDKMMVFVFLGIILWIFVHSSGVHASIVGAFVGLLAPTIRRQNKKSLNQRLENSALPFSTFITLPIFALANAGVILSYDIFTRAENLNLMSGIVIGLIFGKLAGITGVTWLMVKLKLAELPGGVNWLHIVGVSMIAGIGFTVSIFITELAFMNDPAKANVAKISIFIGSIIASVLGVIFLLRAKKIDNMLQKKI